MEQLPATTETAPDTDAKGARNPGDPWSAEELAALRADLGPTADAYIDQTRRTLLAEAILRG